MENYLKKLEYNKILDLLASFAITNLGKEHCLSLFPSLNKDKVKSSLNETGEAINLIIRKGNVPIYLIDDISLALKKLESKNSLSGKELLDVASIFKLSRELKEYFYKDEEFDLSSFPILETYFSSLYSNIGIENKVFSAIIDQDNIADNASSKLSSLRRNRRKLESEIKESLNKIIHSSSYSKAIMEQIVTIRNDRYVIPIKEEFRGMIKGFVHDISSSGSTLFIEPMSVFEMNNSINNIKLEEHLEIERILEELSTLFYPYISELNTNIQMITNLDFAFAKANFAKSLDAILPTVNDKKFINLIKARHPLISPENVVPVDISIGDNYNSLIITGPNTGGKTVSLKTTGLLTLMACSGLAIPTDSSSSIYVFDNIFADIGDEQSIQESLSTFSSHMTNIISILEKASSESLILIDELGSGTDPIEGASLAVSILEHFYNIGALTLVTTHYQEIKNYALVTDGFENASCEFDVENLRPTYKLLVGIPGKSNAFAISKKLGLNPKILNRAQSFMKKDDISIEELLKNIYDDKIQIEKQKEETQRNLNQIELLRKSLDKELTSKKSLENDLIQKFKEEAKNIVLSAKDEVNSDLKELNQIYSKFKALEEINLNSLSDSEIANIVRTNFSADNIRKANEISSKLNKKLKTLSVQEVENTVSVVTMEDLKVGMNIKINTTSEIATIISLSNKSIRVKVGSATMNIKLDNIVSIVKDNHTNIHNTTKNYSKNSSLGTFKSKTILPEINVIGQNIEEACFVIDKYLDDCSLAKLEFVRIVHGKGTGKLREGIHNFLRKHSHVKSFRLGTFGEGEMGVTVVELK